MAKKLKLNCRTCAKIFSSNDLVSIFAEIDNNIFPIDSIKLFHNINFKISENDGLSQFICLNCLKTFVKFVNFIELCENAQKQLQKNGDKYNLNYFEETLNISKILNNVNHNQNEEKIEILDSKLEEYLEFENNEYDNSLSESETETYFNINDEFIDKEFPNFELTDYNEVSMKKCNIIILCELCGLEVPQKNLKKHQNSAEHLGTKLFSCEFCEKSYKSYEVLRQHKYRKHKNEKLTKQKYNCTKCNKSFYDENRLNQHIQNFHKNINSQIKRIFECNECKKSFANIGVLERHLIKFHQNSNKSERKHICIECGRSYPRSDHLQLHMKREHLNEKPFQCGKCGKKYSAGYQLTYHMKSVHTIKSDENFECDICYKIYSKKYAMNRHKKKYHSQNEYMCVICNKKFSNYGKLDRHYSNTHNDVLPHGKIVKTEKFNSTAQKDQKILKCDPDDTDSKENNFNIDIYETEKDIAEIDASFLDLIQGNSDDNSVELLLKEF